MRWRRSRQPNWAWTRHLPPTCRGRGSPPRPYTVGMAKLKLNRPLAGGTWEKPAEVWHTGRWGVIARAKGSTLRYYPGCPWEKRRHPPREPGPWDDVISLRVRPIGLCELYINPLPQGGSRQYTFFFVQHYFLDIGSRHWEHYSVTNVMTVQANFVDQPTVWDSFGVYPEQLDADGYLQLPATIHWCIQYWEQRPLRQTTLCVSSDMHWPREPWRWQHVNLQRDMRACFPEIQYLWEHGAVTSHPARGTPSACWSYALGPGALMPYGLPWPRAWSLPGPVPGECPPPPEPPDDGE